MHPSGQFTALNVTVRQLVLSAYDVRPYQILDAPDWVASQLFDIVAKAPDDFEMGQTKGMMRGLLQDRFGLVVERTTRSIPVYALEWINANRAGPWLRRAGAVCDRPPANAPETTVGPLGGRRAAPDRDAAESKPDSECRGFFGSPFPVSGEGWFYIRRLELASALSPLEGIVGKPVIDKTNLTGLWDLDIKWDPDATVFGGRADSDRRYGSIFTAIREQLGLKLEQVDANVNVLVIRSVMQPMPN